MDKFVPTADFKSLNVGFSLDEGIAGPTEEYPVFYAERSIWRKYGFCLKSASINTNPLEQTSTSKSPEPQGMDLSYTRTPLVKS